MPPSFPVDAARDLLGICRAIALATPLEQRGRRARLREIGDVLVRALELAHRFPAPGWGHFAAVECAQDATRRLGEEIGALMPAAAVLQAAETRAAWSTRRGKVG